MCTCLKVSNEKAFLKAEKHTEVIKIQYYKKKGIMIKCCLIWIKWNIYLVNKLSCSQGIIKVKVFTKNLRCFYVKLDRMKMYKLDSFSLNLVKKSAVFNN